MAQLTGQPTKNYREREPFYSERTGRCFVVDKEEVEHFHRWDRGDTDAPPASMERSDKPWRS